MQNVIFFNIHPFIKLCLRFNYYLKMLRLIKNVFISIIYYEKVIIISSSSYSLLLRWWCSKWWLYVLFCDDQNGSTTSPDVSETTVIRRQLPQSSDSSSVLKHLHIGSPLRQKWSGLISKVFGNLLSKIINNILINFFVENNVLHEEWCDVEDNMWKDCRSTRNDGLSLSMFANENTT